MYLQIPKSNVRIMGSFHFAPRGGVPVPQWAKDAYAWCESLITEHDVAPVVGRMAADVPLDQLLRPDLWTALKDFLPNQAAREEFRMRKPWAASMALSAGMLDFEPGIEPHFEKWAAMDAKPISRLESPDDFVAAIESIPLADIEASLVYALANRRKAQANFVAMHTAWRQRDPKRLHAAVAGSPMAALPNFRAGALTIRNRAWATSITALVGTERRTLVTVGALHLLGQGKLQEHLGVDLVPATAQ